VAREIVPPLILARAQLPFCEKVVGEETADVERRDALDDDVAVSAGVPAPQEAGERSDADIAARAVSDP